MHKVIYSGIDWLSIGIYLKTKNEEYWNNLIDDFKKRIGETIKDEPFKFEIMTSRNLAKQRFSIMLIEKKFNITFKITKAPKTKKITDVENGIVKMPDLLIEIPARALRPQNLAYTENAIKKVVEILKAEPYAMIYSRIDFNTDVYNPSMEFLKKTLDNFQYLHKEFIAGVEKIEIENEFQEVKRNKEYYNFRKGSKGYKEISEYKKLSRDSELIQIYSQNLGKAIDREELKRIWRIELRINRKYLRLHKDWNISKIQKIKSINLIKFLDEAYKIFEEDKSLKKVKELYTEQEHPQIFDKRKLRGYIKEVSIKQAQTTTEEIYKIILGLFNKSYELLKTELNIQFAEDVFYHFFYTISKMKEYIEEKATEKDFFKLLKNGINYIRDLKETIFKNAKRINIKLEEKIIDFKNYKYEKVKNSKKKQNFGGVTPETPRKFLFFDEEIDNLAIDF